MTKYGRQELTQRRQKVEEKNVGRGGESGVCGREQSKKGYFEPTMGEITMNGFYCQHKYILSVYHCRVES